MRKKNRIQENNQYDRMYNIVVESERMDEIIGAVVGGLARGAAAVGRGALAVGKGVVKTGTKVVKKVAGSLGNAAKQKAKDVAVNKVQQKLRPPEEEETI